MAMAIVICKQQHDDWGPGSNMTFSDVIIISNNNTIFDARNSNIMSDAIPIQLNPSTTQIMERGKNAVLVMVLIADVLKLKLLVMMLMLIKTPARDLLALQVLLLLLKAAPRWNASLVVSSNTVLAAERLTITITKWAMTLGNQQGT